jgi:uncharacterized protein (DUF58 family)
VKEKVFLPPELINRIKGIQIKAKHLVNATFAGEYKSAFKGRGMEFDEVREYVPGDDVRTIDWNVTARSGHPYVKLFKDERELTVLFMVDVSASSRFGTVSKFKNEVAAEIAALLAWLALRNNDKVGLLIFSDRIEHYVPPKKGRGHVWQIIRDILTYKSESRKTDFKAPLEFINRVLKNRAITFLISDFMGESYETPVKTTARHHELIAITVTDPREMELPGIGYIELEDAETGESILVDTADKKFLKNYSQAARERARTTRDFFEGNGIDHIQVLTDGNHIRPVVEFFRRREKMNRKGKV